MKAIGENLNVISKRIGDALKERDPKPIREMAEAETKAGVDLIDINLGPARKAGADLMEWVVKTVQEVTDTPLCLDTTNVEAIEAGAAGGEGHPLAWRQRRARAPPGRPAPHPPACTIGRISESWTLHPVGQD